jgi:2',3'-cyclic-nucleotide 2'-phosphodiesterase (5'-nucleotidase family)
LYKRVDIEDGTVNGVPFIMPGKWGNQLGIIDLELKRIRGEWKVLDSHSELNAIYQDGKQLVGTDDAILSILSAGAPFKAGESSGASYYTYIPQGTLVNKNVSDLYLYPNTVATVKVTGADVKEWLEMSAGQFNQIGPSKGDGQSLINNDFPTYNFDVIDRVTYEIDVTEPAKYDGDGNVIHPKANRIKNLKYNGEPIDLNQPFIVVTNNYHANGTFPGVRNSTEVTMYPDENRQAIIDFIREKGTIDPTADGNWKFASPTESVKVMFQSSPDATKTLTEKSLIEYIGKAENGFARYTLTIE